MLNQKVDLELVKALYKKAGSQVGCADKIFVCGFYHGEDVDPDTNEGGYQLHFNVYVPNEYSDDVLDAIKGIIKDCKGRPPFYPDDVHDGERYEKPGYSVHDLSSWFYHPDVTDDFGNACEEAQAKLKSLAELLGVEFSADKDNDIIREAFKSVDTDVCGTFAEWEPVM